METILVLVVLVVLCIVILVLYQLFRLKLSANVNCWFCNENSSVPYGSRNSWDCCFCGQYNGFKADGDYNKVIPAMFCEDSSDTAASPSGDHSFTSTSVHTMKPRNNDRKSHDLCSVCSQNQLLKIKQLANFVPQNEANFDIEVEAYKHHLEQVYRLCHACDLTVRQELTRQDAVIRSKMHSVGLLRSPSTINANVSRLSNTDFFVSESAPTTSKVFGFISLLLQFVSLLVGLLLAAAMLDSVAVSYSLLSLVDSDILRVVRQYSGPVAAVGVFVQIAAVKLADHSRVRPIDVVTCFSLLLTMLACGWLGESAVVVIMRLMLASLSLVIASYALVSHTCSEPHFESHLSHESADKDPTLATTVSQRSTTTNVERTKPDDPKFVARLKTTLDLGVSCKHHTSKGPFAMSAEWANQLPVPDSVRQRSTVAHGFTAQRDRPLLSPAKFIPASSTSLTVSIRPPSKWSPVSSGGCHWSNKPSSKTSKSADDVHNGRYVGPDIINGCDRQADE